MTDAQKALEALDATVLKIKDKHEFAYSALDLVVEHGMTIRSLLKERAEQKEECKKDPNSCWRVRCHVPKRCADKQHQGEQSWKA